jgi:hypothetical protein
MWEQKTGYSRYGIEATSYCTKNDKIEDYYKLGIFFSSFESRCLTGSSLIKKGNLENSIIVFFKQKDDKGLREKNDLQLFENVKEISKNEPMVIDDLDMFDISGGATKLITKISTFGFNQDDSFFLDISGALKPFYLAILAYFRKKTFPPTIHVFTPTGSYKDDKDVNTGNIEFTIGHDRYEWIPNYGSDGDPVTKKVYVLLLGFEGKRASQALYRFNPEIFYLCIGNPGYQPDYYDSALEKNKNLIDLTKEIMGDDHIIQCHAADAVSAWKVLQEKFEPIQKDHQICIIPLGPKSHAVGAGLYALTTWKPDILYMVPKRYVYRDNKRGKYVWIFKIKL